MELVPQYIVNGILFGSLLALPAIGFTTIFAVMRFPNFSVASMATIGAFAAFVVNVHLGLPVIASVLVAFLVAGAVGVASDMLVLQPMRPHGALTTAIASIALTIVLENIVRFIFGNDLRGYDLPILRDWRFGMIRVGPQQVENLILSVVVMAALFAFLRFGRWGKAMRAVADNPDLAQLKGIPSQTVVRLTTFIAMGLVGIGGVLQGLGTAIDPLTGFRFILSIFAAAVVGGLGSIPGAVAGAFVIGIGEELSLAILDPTYKSSIGFLAILLVLTLKPEGLFGARRP
ncbi:MAG: branched-chain amino acid ABC transporter permease [Geminicoccaceae bacterium]|nr:branched-chain amino acid ABC transporter permease [Geminicoccaceae bacterium]MCB9945372.1 branched-chain amino acid ABC transporter permease [Geminicoccaceae bacterium]